MRSLAVMALLVVAGPAGLAATRAEGPTRVTCSEKTYPKIEGRNAVTLVREANGSYTASFESYGPPRSRKSLKCAFDVNPVVFHCETATASWEVFGRKLDEKSIDAGGKVTDLHVYEIEAVKSPEGDPRREQSIRFPLEACKAEL